MYSETTFTNRVVINYYKFADDYIRSRSNAQELVMAFKANLSNYLRENFVDYEILPISANHLSIPYFIHFKTSDDLNLFLMTNLFPYYKKWQ